MSRYIFPEVLSGADPVLKAEYNKLRQQYSDAKRKGNNREERMEKALAAALKVHAQMSSATTGAVRDVLGNTDAEANEAEYHLVQGLECLAKMRATTRQASMMLTEEPPFKKAKKEKAGIWSGSKQGQRDR